MDVYALATGAMLSSGLFLLPGIAAARVGPGLPAAYLLALVPLLPATLSMVELATAMPRAGGPYYFLDRSLGPMVGVVGGLGTWFSLVLKTAFALVGMAAYLDLLLPQAPHGWVAGALAVGFGALNWRGTGETGRFQIGLVAVLLRVLAWFSIAGLPEIDPARFHGFWEAGAESMMATAGMVYVSYGGVTKVVSVSEEVRDPERNLPVGIFLALATAVSVYLVCTVIAVGVVPMESLRGHLTPIAEAASRLGGAPASAVVSLAALLAFASVANAGILSASRYPLAMARDHLVPRWFGRMSKRGTPASGIAVTVAAILLFLIVLDPAGIAKLASAFQLLVFALLCAAVIVMRESGLESYDPGYRSPGYPWMQVVGIVSAMTVASAMGWMPRLFTLTLTAVGLSWYFYYARQRVVRHGAIYHVFERLGRERFGPLDTELRSILKEKGLRERDPFEEIVARAAVIDIDRGRSFEDIALEAARRLAPRTGQSAQRLARGFLEGTRTGATPVSRGVALPHLRVRGLAAPEMVLVRDRRGVALGTDETAGNDSELVRALFFVVSPDHDPGLHLRILAQLASRVDEEGFLAAWFQAEDEHDLKRALLRSDRCLTLRVDAAGPTGELAGRALREAALPLGTLVALVRRQGRVIVPRGDTVIEAGDILTLIGDADAISALRARYGDESGSPGPGAGSGAPGSR